MPMRAPKMPTDNPLNMRNPDADMENTPITRPRIAPGACSWTRACAIELNANSTNPATNKRPTAST